MNPAPEWDVVVVGAGVAGLTCALDLSRAGLRVHVLEAGDAPGGRMRTDRRDGFLLDRGFQVFNPAYPQVKKRIDLDRLDLRPLMPGYLLRTGGDTVTVADPRRDPGSLATVFRSRPGSVRDLAALAMMSARDGLAPVERLKTAPEEPAWVSLRAAGMSARFIDDVLRPFFSGVFLEPDLTTSSRVFHLVWRSMLKGRIGLPAAGIGAVPRQLAADLPAGVLELESPVGGLTEDGVLLSDGRHLTARDVVVAVDPKAAARLLPAMPPVPTRSVTTFYHAAARSPLGRPMIVVDADSAIVNTLVLTDVAPTYSQDGRALISTSVLGGGDVPDEASVLRRLAEVYDCDTGGWESIARYDIQDALPAMPPPWPLTRTTRWSAGRYLCGDHRGTGSVQGAMASGARAAREVLRDLQGDRATGQLR